MLLLCFVQMLLVHRSTMKEAVFLGYHLRSQFQSCHSSVGDVWRVRTELPSHFPLANHTNQDIQTYRVNEIVLHNDTALFRTFQVDSKLIPIISIYILTYGYYIIPMGIIYCYTYNYAYLSLRNSTMLEPPIKGVDRKINTALENC